MNAKPQQTSKMDWLPREWPVTMEPDHVCLWYHLISLTSIELVKKHQITNLKTSNLRNNFLMVVFLSFFFCIQEIFYIGYRSEIFSFNKSLPLRNNLHWIVRHIHQFWKKYGIINFPYFNNLFIHQLNWVFILKCIEWI